MTTNPCGKMRKVDTPYATFKSGDWEWRILKRYQTRANEAKNAYARVLVAVKSPFTYGSFEMGDTYVKDLRGEMVQEDDAHKAWRTA